MADYHPASIANEFVELNDGYVPQMKLHKLAYMAHGWGLAIEREALIRDQPEAWDNGPVYRTIWNRIRDYGLAENGKILRPNGRPYSADLTNTKSKSFATFGENIAGIARMIFLL